MTLKEFNRFSKDEAATELMLCCGSVSWTKKIMKFFPFESEMNMVNNATRIWYDACTSEDWKEAFSHHPKIGDSKYSDKKKTLSRKMAASEQSGMNKADRNVL